MLRSSSPYRQPIPGLPRTPRVAATRRPIRFRCVLGSPDTKHGRQRLCHSVSHARTTTQFFFEMNDFQSKREEKAPRFSELAEKHENISTGRYFAVRQQLEMIPLGQPILVGHHSEKRQRSYLKRIDQHFAKAQEHHEKAEHYRRHAGALES